MSKKEKDALSVTLILAATLMLVICRLITGEVGV